MFESIDDVVARYVAPFSGSIREAITEQDFSSVRPEDFESHLEELVISGKAPHLYSIGKGYLKIRFEQLWASSMFGFERVENISDNGVRVLFEESIYLSENDVSITESLRNWVNVFRRERANVDTIHKAVWGIINTNRKVLDSLGVTALTIKSDEAIKEEEFENVLRREITYNLLSIVNDIEKKASERFYTSDIVKNKLNSNLERFNYRNNQVVQKSIPL